MTYAIAVAQTVSVPADLPANIRQHIRLAVSAARLQAQVVVFPELSLTGYELAQASRLALEPDAPQLDPLREVARTAKLTLVVGAPARLAGKLHIGAFILSPNGMTALHTKQFLGAFAPEDNPSGPIPPDENAIFQPGEHTPLIRLAGCTAAIGICAESLRAPYAEAARARGADVYLTSHFGIPGDGASRARRLREHAVRCQMTVAFANHGGPSGGMPAGGHSAIWSPNGELLGKLDPSGCGVLVATHTGAGWRTTRDTASA